MKYGRLLLNIDAQNTISLVMSILIAKCSSGLALSIQAALKFTTVITYPLILALQEV